MRSFFSILCLTTIVLLGCLFFSDKPSYADSIFSDLEGRIIEYRTKTLPSIIKSVELSSLETSDVFTSKKWFAIEGFDTAKISGDKILKATSIQQPGTLILLRDGHLLIFEDDERDIMSLPAFSNDCRKLAYAGSKGIYLLDVEEYFRPVKISDISCSNLSRPSWLPDDKRLVVGSNDWKIYLVDIAQGNKIEAINFGIKPSVSPDGKKIAYLSKEADDEEKEAQRNMWKYAIGTGDKAIEHLSWWKRFKWNYDKAVYVYDVDTHQSIKITKYYSVISPLVWSPDGKYLAFTGHWGATTHNMYILNVQTHEIRKIPDLEGVVMTWIK